MNEQEESRNPFDVPREEWTIDDRANALRQGNYVTRLKTWAIADAGIFDVAQIAKQRLDSLCWSTEIETACVCEGGLFINPEFFDSMTLPPSMYMMPSSPSEEIFRISVGETAVRIREAGS